MKYNNSKILINLFMHQLDNAGEQSDSQDYSE